MPKDKTISVIDIGSSKISSITATIHENKINVIGVSGPSESRGINKGSVINIDDAVKSIDRSCQKTDKMAGFPIHSAFVTINGSHIESQNSQAVVAINSETKEITINDVERVLESSKAISIPNNREIIHVIPNNFTVDGNEGIVDPVGMYGSRLEVHTTIIHVSSMIAKNLRKCVTSVGVGINELVYVGIASGEAVLTESEKEMGVALVDIGSTTTSMVVFHNKAPVFCTTIAIGGKHITNDIAIHLRCSTEIAEKIKVRLSEERVVPSAATFENSRLNETLNPIEFGLDNEVISKRALFKIIDDRVEEIVNLILVEIRKNHLLNKIPAGIVFTGGSSKTAGLEKIAKMILKLPTKIGFPKGVEGMVEEISDPEYSASVGLLIYAYKKITENNDLSTYKKDDKLMGIIKKFISKFLP
jgi:cell division protein FtsA